MGWEDVTTGFRGANEGHKAKEMEGADSKLGLIEIEDLTKDTV